MIKTTRNNLSFISKSLSVYFFLLLLRPFFCLMICIMTLTSYISELLEPVLYLVFLDLLLLCILKYCLNGGNSVFHFFELIFDTLDRSNLFESGGAQAFNDLLDNAIQDCIGHLLLLDERKHSKLS